MTRIEWDPSLETGDPIVDLQHRAIHNLFNQLQCAADGVSEVLATLDYLTQHVLVHFATEEALMDREEFPESLTVSHVSAHRALTEEVREHVLAFRAGNLTSTASLIPFLHDWLTVHVHDCDRKLIEHVRARGASAAVPEEWATVEL